MASFLMNYAQEKMRYFPPKKKLMEWMKSGKVTGSKPRRLKREKDENGDGVGEWLEVRVVQKRAH